MKPRTTIAIAGVAGLLGIGAAAVTLPAEAPSAQSASTVEATPTPEVRTEVVHRHRRGHHRREHPVATAAPAPAPVIVVEDDDDRGHHGGDDDSSGHGGHGRDHPEDD